jgi:threonine dehydratase
METTEQKNDAAFNLSDEIERAKLRLKDVIKRTPLEQCASLSELFEAEIYLKREDRQILRSYKIRGAFNKISSLSKSERAKGLVCASAGNHAQGFALTCAELNLHGKVFMPVTTPLQKVNKVKKAGKSNVEVILVGDTFDEANFHALKFACEKDQVFIHPFDDLQIIAGQATVASEIVSQVNFPIDYLVFPVGGGGLAAGLISVFSKESPKTKCIAVEPFGASSLTLAIKCGKPETLDSIDRFIDGAAVKKVGETNFVIIKDKLSKVLLVPEGKVCSTLLNMYNEEAIVLEPAGALSIAALDQIKTEIKGKRVVCVVSGGNNDITRMEEMKERSLRYEGMKHYFMIEFPQRPGALKFFVNTVLTDGCDISFFEYTRRNAREKGPALVGLELKAKSDLPQLQMNLLHSGFKHEYLNDKEEWLNLMI